MKLIGRKAEIADLDEIIESKQAEFVIVYGRRRVGKTFLVREYFGQKFAFYHTGMANTDMEGQLKVFNSSLHKYGEMPYPQVKTWFEAFEQLTHLLAHHRRQAGKKVVFIDEMPWMDTQNSGFIQGLEWFWNSWASAQHDILLIVCGSATSWIINNLINNHGGLHNRVTRQIYLRPFTLAECEAYFKLKNIEITRHEIVENYMIFGGIPYYLSLMKKQFSMAQNIDNICFKEKGELTDEFANLYASLFRHSEKHVQIVEALSRKTRGLTRDEIIEFTKLPNGGGLTRILKELDLSGFIRKYRGYGKKKRDALYQLTDFFTLFYFNFMYDSRNDDEHYWTNLIENARHRAWSGYAFEQVCMAHIRQIKQKLGIAGVLTNVSSWRSKETDPGAQVDLVIERNDRVINLCEMKFSNKEFVIDAKYDTILRHKRATFREELKTQRAVHLTMITTFGVKHNAYWGNIQSEVVIDDLFA